MTETKNITADLVGLLNRVLMLRDDGRRMLAASKLLEKERAAMKAWRKTPRADTRARAQAAILASAMLCDLQGNNLGYQDARFRRLKELG